MQAGSTYRDKGDVLHLQPCIIEQLSSQGCQDLARPYPLRRSGLLILQTPA